RESLMHVEISEQNDPERRAFIADRLATVLEDVRHAVTDWPKMRKMLATTLEDIESRPLPMPTREINEVAAVLRWLDGDNFLFLGLSTSLAYSRSPRSIPILRLKVQRTFTRAGFSPSSHDGKALQHILDTLPRDELLQISENELFETALGILNLQERQRIALFVRRDPLE